MDNLTVTIPSLLLGALIGGLSKVLQDAYAKRQEAKAVAAALRAEISVLVDGIKRGRYIELLDRVIAHLSRPGHIVQADDFLEAPVSQTPLPVFAAHCGKIGLLGKAAEAVVKTYLLAETAGLDLRFLPERHKRQPLTAAQLVTFHQGLKRSFEGIVTSGELAMQQLQR